MKMEEHQEKWVKRMRLLTHALLLSGGLNIGLLATFFYFVLKDKEVLTTNGQVKQVEVAKEKSNSDYLSNFAKLSFKELVPHLNSAEKVDEGYSRRDLALAALVKYHYFNLEKALPGQNLQKRKIIFSKDGKEEEIILFSALNEEQYKAIVQFAYSEKWPLTAPGLFLHLKEQKPRDQSLEWAFALTAEFHSIRALFNREGEVFKPELILDLLCEMSWESIDKFVQEQNTLQDWSKERLRVFLLSAFEQNSTLATRLLVAFDAPYIVKKMSDEEVIKLLTNLSDSTENKNLCLELLQSARSDEVWKSSSAKLYAWASEEMVEPYDHQKALERFLGVTVKRKTVTHNTVSGIAHERKYVVQVGDNPWKIARKNKVDVKALISANKLDGKNLRPGQELKIPD